MSDLIAIGYPDETTGDAAGHDDESLRKRRTDPVEQTFDVGLPAGGKVVHGRDAAEGLGEADQFDDSVIWTPEVIALVRKRELYGATW